MSRNVLKVNAVPRNQEEQKHQICGLLCKEGALDVVHGFGFRLRAFVFSSSDRSGAHLCSKGTSDSNKWVREWILFAERFSLGKGEALERSHNQSRGAVNSLLQLSVLALGCVSQTTASLT